MMFRGGDKDPAYAFEWVAAPPELTPYLNSFYILRVGSAEVADTMPAYSGQLMIVLKGGACMAFPDETRGHAGAAGFMCPLTRAHDFTLEAGTIVVGASLNFRGWASLTRLAVDEFSDRYLPASEGLGPKLAERAENLRPRFNSGEITENEALDVLIELVREGITPLSDRHQQVIGTTLSWLSSSFKPQIAVLQDELPYSERQVQRLVARFFGQPPVRLIRRYRAIRAATLLAMPELPPAIEAEISAAFYDQAHMIKEIRYFTGRTPRRLQPKAASIITETLAEPGYGSVDLFGGTQDKELGKN